MGSVVNPLLDGTSTCLHVGGFRSSAQEAWPLYNCKVGAKLRELIPLRLLQAPLEEGMQVLVAHGREQSGRILEAPVWQMTHLTTYLHRFEQGSRRLTEFSRAKIRSVEVRNLQKLHSWGGELARLAGVCQVQFTENSQEEEQFDL